MLNPYHEAFDIQRVLNLQNMQYSNSVYFERVIPANSRVDGSVQITGQGHFMMLAMTGSYTTQGDQEDTGICQVSVQLLDGNNDRALFNEPIPANLFLSPGRVRYAANVGDPSQPLRMEYAHPYTFVINGSIRVICTNDSGFDQTLRIMFKGIRIYPRNR